MSRRRLELVQDEPAEMTSLKVLLVDDSEDDAVLLARYLRTCWSSVTHLRVETQAELAAALAGEHWEAVLCDCHLPQLTVAGALNTITQHDRTLPVIMVTGAVGEDELVKLVKLGAHDIVLKDNLARLRPAIERGIAEAQLRRDKNSAEIRLAGAIESISQGIALFDRESKLTTCNRRYRAILSECSALIFPGQDYREILRYGALHGQFEDIGADVDGFVREQLAQHLQAGECAELKLCDGRWVTFEDTPTGDGGVISVLTDVTERKKLEIMKSEFVSVVSHELRTPLTSIKGSLSLLESGIAGGMSDKAHSMVTIAHKNSDRLKHLIDDILDIQKIEAGSMRFELEKLAVRPALEQAIASNQPYADTYGVKIELDCAEHDCVILADSKRLMQVLTNLLSNAAKFSPSGSAITLGARANGSTVRIFVTDRGPGIPPAIRSRIFEKFCQADSSSVRPREGTGLGLAISKAMVEGHGGKIGFKSSDEGGTTFYVDLPVWQQAAADNAPSHMKWTAVA